MPSLLHIKESDRLSVLEEEVTCPSVEDSVTWRTLNLLGHLVTKVLDNQLCVCVCVVHIDNIYDRERNLKTQQ